MDIVLDADDSGGDGGGDSERGSERNSEAEGKLLRILAV